MSQTTEWAPPTDRPIEPTSAPGPDSEWTTWGQAAPGPRRRRLRPVVMIGLLVSVFLVLAVGFVLLLADAAGAAGGCGGF